MIMVRCLLSVSEQILSGSLVYLNTSASNKIIAIHCYSSSSRIDSGRLGKQSFFQYIFQQPMEHSFTATLLMTVSCIFTLAVIYRWRTLKLKLLLTLKKLALLQVPSRSICGVVSFFFCVITSINKALCLLRTVNTARGNVTYRELEECVFSPNNFKLITARYPLPVLDFIMKPTCEQVRQ